jgi:GT2 family glycosyltransferase
MKKVFISIINYENLSDTKQCLQSIDGLQTEGLELQVVLIDNASKEQFDLDEKFLKKFPMEIIRNSKNLGFSGGHNAGIKYALSKNADYVLILNNDTYLDKNIIAELVKEAEEDSRTGIVSPKIYFAKGHEFHKDRYKNEDLGKVIWYAGGKMDWANVIGKHVGVDEVDKGQFENTGKTDFASGCCMLIKKEVFEKIGFFDEKYFLYYEDNDFSQRSKTAGFNLIYDSKAMLWHINAGSAGGSGSGLQDYYITRNRLLFGMKYAPFKAKFALVRESVKLTFFGRKWQRKGVVDYYFKRFGKGSYS